MLFHRALPSNAARCVPGRRKRQRSSDTGHWFAWALSGSRNIAYRALARPVGAKYDKLSSTPLPYRFTESQYVLGGLWGQIKGALGERVWLRPGLGGR
jgi:hypothetical protein